jgi:hypothetical protein
MTVTVRFNLVDDNKLPQGSLDEVVRNYLWQVCPDGPTWDKGYTMFVERLLTLTEGSLAERVTAALEYVVGQNLSSTRDPDDAQRRGKLLEEYAVPKRDALVAITSKPAKPDQAGRPDRPDRPERAAK